MILKGTQTSTAACVGIVSSLHDDRVTVWCQDHIRVALVLILGRVFFLRVFRISTASRELGVSVCIATIRMRLCLVTTISCLMFLCLLSFLSLPFLSDLLSPFLLLLFLLQESYSMRSLSTVTAQTVDEAAED